VRWSRPRGRIAGTYRDPPPLARPIHALIGRRELKIVIVDESPIRSLILEEGLRDAGFTQVERISEMHNLLKHIYASDPDVILIDLENPSRDTLEQMFQVSRAVRRRSPCLSIRAIRRHSASVDAGVSAYIVDGLKKERIKSILDLCVSRFNAFSKLQDDLEQAKSDLDERKTIERAKGILMKAKSFPKTTPTMPRGPAMRENKKIIEIARRSSLRRRCLNDRRSA
jgi:response regulator NasT